MNDRMFLKFELVCLLLVSNLGSFAIGMMLPIMNFQVGKFLSGLEPYHWLTITIGLAVFVFGVINMAKRINDAI